MGHPCDNCPNDHNPNQEDQDTDGEGDACDNCPNDSNPNQEDADNDELGDACDNCPDLHLQQDPNGAEDGNHLDCDRDQIGDACDYCPGLHLLSDPNQPIDANHLDTDGDQIGDACDKCPELHLQQDPNEPVDGNHLDTDGDGFGDACDICPRLPGQNPEDCESIDVTVGETFQPPPGFNEGSGQRDAAVRKGDAQYYYDRHRNQYYVVTNGYLDVEFTRDGEVVRTLSGNVRWPSARFHVIEAPPVDLMARSDVGDIHLFTNTTGVQELDEGHYFTASAEGRCTVVYELGADPGSEGVLLEVVRSIRYDDPDLAAWGVKRDVGRPISPTFHDFSCRAPWVVHEQGPYIAGEFFYDREGRQGPIIPAHPGRLAVVLYTVGEESGVCWPYRPVHYDCRWPANPDGTIVIASGEGTGPLPYEDIEVYRQTEENKPGYNLNDEHALVKPAQGSSPRLLLPKRIMVLEGSTTSIEGRILGAASLQGDNGETVAVAIDVSGKREEDGHLTYVEPPERLELDQDTVLTPFTLTFAAATELVESEELDGTTIVIDPGDSENGKRDFTVRASGSMNSIATITVREADTDRLGLFVDRFDLDIPEGASEVVRIRLTKQPEENVDVETARLDGGDPDLVVTSGENLVFTPENWKVPQDVVITAREDGDEANGRATFRVSASGGLTQVGDVMVHEFESAPGDQAVFALRCDLNPSEPYVLVKYTQETDEGRTGGILVYEVVAEQGDATFNYFGSAGKLIQPPYPLSLLGPCKESAPGVRDGTHGVSGPFWQDRKGSFWAMAAGFEDDGGEPPTGFDDSDDPAPADIIMRFFYPMQPGFDFPGEPPPAGRIPWLDRLGAGAEPGTPVAVTYTVCWPDACEPCGCEQPTEVPELRAGESVVKPKFGLPNITDQCSVDIVYQEAHRHGLESVHLIEPEALVPPVPLPRGLPEDFNTALDFEAGSYALVDLPPGLRERIRFNDLDKQLELRGVFDNSGIGEPMILMNVLSERDEARLLSLLEESDADETAKAEFEGAVVELASLSREQAGKWSLRGAETTKALTAGFAGKGGYVTLAMQNDPDSCGNLPVSLEIIKVTCPLYCGEIKVIEPACPFDEMLTLQHSGDFAGRVDEYEFEWLIQSGGSRPATPVGDPPHAGWSHHDGGDGAVATTLEGAGLQTITDNWLTCRYRRVPTGDALGCDQEWSDWTRPVLAEGWIKRVMNGIGPFEQIVEDFATNRVDTTVSMVSQAGRRWDGNIALNCDSDQGFGLIEAYQTVFGLGIALTLDAEQSNQHVNDALLLAAGRIADLYMLLGNEAYSDALDPTVGFGTEDGREVSATSIHAFDNQLPSLLEEELALLRGRSHVGEEDDPVDLPPHYNRLLWNFTAGITEGEVAYALNYDISDEQGNKDGEISEEDAMDLYPQGHGDAWGHYLSAIKSYYRLLHHPEYTWQPRVEYVRVGGVSGTEVQVDYLDERKFARAAVAKARCGAHLVNLTYRQYYTEDPEGQYQGYKDPRSDERAWGLSEWACRAGQGAYIDWVVGNALLPHEDNNPDHEGIRKIDRTTVRELHELASLYTEIEADVLKADLGVNPLGVARNVVPFDIDREQLGPGDGRTHFEQVYDRAVEVLQNAVTVFNYANQSTQLLRNQQDKLDDFLKNIEERERDFENRLIENFGYPYRGDTPDKGGIYSEDELNGPDLFHYSYVDPSELMGIDPPTIETFTLDLGAMALDEQGGLHLTTRPVTFHLSTNGFGLVKPRADWGRRRAPGEIQLVRSDLLQAKARFERALEEYDNHLAEVQRMADLLEAQHDVNAREIEILEEGMATQESLNDLIAQARARQLDWRSKGRIATIFANALAEALPRSAGAANDVTSVARSAIMIIGSVLSEAANVLADQAAMEELGHQQAKERTQAENNITLTTLRHETAILQQIAQLQRLVRSEASLRLDVYAAFEAMQQTAGRYQTVLARGQRLLEDRLRFRRETAAEVQEYRYRDMTFRIFRNDALQKYRAQFDMAARYVYLTATAYDYETNLLRTDTRGPGQRFLTDIVRERVIGQISGEEMYDGLAGVLELMHDRWTDELKPSLGFSDPQIEPEKAFSLRWELFRIGDDLRGDENWRRTLAELVVDNIFDDPRYPEIPRFCKQFSEEAEPGIVIPFSTTITAGQNLFGQPKGGGDHSYLPENFTTKIHSVGVWLSNYDITPGSGMADDPGVFLVPVGMDVMRPPTGELGEEDLRYWRIFDQAIPSVDPLVDQSRLEDELWIPSLDVRENDTNPAGTMSEEFGKIRRFIRLIAKPGDGTITGSMVESTRLVGRSVWNTRWLLIIPAESLHSDRKEGLARFIHGRKLPDGTRDGLGVSDIFFVFSTYAYAGN